MRDFSHPCIVAWVPFNESWGVPDLPDSPAQRHYVQALYHLTKTLDPTRPVIGNDGWESVATDIIGIHDYDDQPERILSALRSGRCSHACSSASGPAAGCSRWQSTPQDSRSCLRNSAASRFRKTSGSLGLLARETAEDFARSGIATCFGRSRASLPGGLLLHAVRRYVSGGQRTALRRPHAEIPARGDRARHPRAANPAGLRIEWEWRERLMNRQRARSISCHLPKISRRAMNPR